MELASEGVYNPAALWEQTSADNDGIDNGAHKRPPLGEPACPSACWEKESNRNRCCWVTDAFWPEFSRDQPDLQRAERKEKRLSMGRLLHVCGVWGTRDKKKETQEALRSETKLETRVREEITRVWQLLKLETRATTFMFYVKKTKLVSYKCLSHVLLT